MGTTVGLGRHAILAAAVLLFGFTVAPAHAQPTAVDDTLTRAVSADGLAGVIAVLGNGPGRTWHTAGYSDVDARTGFVPHTHVRAASITKTFVAATVLQLVAEGKVALDAPIEPYLPGRIRGTGIDANAITVRQLLRHQSGLPEYFDADTPPPAEPATADQLLDMALRRPAQFAPGSEMRYTNTNYVIAGLMIESVTGRPAAEAITWRIIVPLGLFDTYFPAPGDTGLRAPFAHGYELVDGQRKDVTGFNASAAGMAGSLISTNEDMATFIAALLDGRVVPPAQLGEMTDTVEQPELGSGFRYGLGLASIELPCGITVWGHGGDIEGYHSLMAKPVDGPAFSVTITQSPQSESITDDPRAAVLDAVYCPTT